MKAQVVIEFLFSFLIVAVAIGLLSLAILSASHRAEGEVAKLSRLIWLEQIARLNDNIYCSGTAIAVGTDANMPLLQGSRIVSAYGNRTAYISGLFNATTKDGEAI